MDKAAMDKLKSEIKEDVEKQIKEVQTKLNDHFDHQLRDLKIKIRD